MEVRVPYLLAGVELTKVPTPVMFLLLPLVPYKVTVRRQEVAMVVWESLKLVIIRRSFRLLRETLLAVGDLGTVVIRVVFVPSLTELRMLPQTTYLVVLRMYSNIISVIPLQRLLKNRLRPVGLMETLVNVSLLFTGTPLTVCPTLPTLTTRRRGPHCAALIKLTSPPSTPVTP